VPRQVRPFFSTHSTGEVELADRLVIQKGILPSPLCCIVLIGYSRQLAAVGAHFIAGVSVKNRNTAPMMIAVTAMPGRSEPSRSTQSDA
jgi:hypothetical protein